jgi:hypothetical protein
MVLEAKAKAKALIVVVVVVVVSKLWFIVIVKRDAPSRMTGCRRESMHWTAKQKTTIMGRLIMSQSTLQ